jgi:DNA-binding NarL/FixJ family response regulator
VVDSMIRILLADRQVLFRDAVASALDAEPDMEIVAHASDRAETLSKMTQRDVNVAVVESELLPLDGFDTGSERTGCHVIVVAEPDDERALLRAVDSGAGAFVTKDAFLSELVLAVRAVVRGETVIPPRLLGGLLQKLRGRQEPVTPAAVSEVGPPRQLQEMDA